MEFFEIIQNCLQIFGIFIRFLDFSIRFLFEIFAKVYEIFSSDTPLAVRVVTLINSSFCVIFTLFYRHFISLVSIKAKFDKVSFENICSLVYCVYNILEQICLH